MIRRLLFPLLATLLSWVLTCPALLCQEPHDSLQTRDEQRSIIKPNPKLAKKFFEQAEKEEEAGDHLRALSDYEAAASYAPFDVNIVNKAAALRSKLVREYVDDAERLSQEGNLDGATMQFEAALEIDPHNTVLLERLQQMGSRKADTEAAEISEPAEGLPRLFPQKVTRSFHLQTDAKLAYEQVAQAYGIKASFDPDLPARGVRLRLDNVDFYTALKVLGIESGTFWRPVNSKLIFIAADTAEKRKAFDLEIEQTFYLPNSSGSQEIGEVVRAVRELTGLTHTTQSVAAHSITVRGTVQRVRLAREIIRNLELGRGEVLLEVDLLEVDRSTARNLGITPPASTTIYPVPPSLASALRSAPDLTALLTLVAQVFGGPAGGVAAGSIASLASSIPPFIAFGGGKTTFLLGLPTFTANFSDGLSLVHSGRQVLLRAQDGKPATFFVGQRYPITLSLLSGSLGSAGFTANPGGTALTIPTEQFPVGTGPVAMVTADFRSSGTQDLAVVNQVDNTLTILLNQGEGANPQLAQPTTGIGLVSPISLGTAWTTSTPAPALATGSLNASSTAANSDSFADLLVTDPVGNTVIVLLGDGDGSFKKPATPIPVGNQPSGIVVGTFNSKNGDSNLGFVVTNFKDNTYSVFNGNGDGTFTPVKGSPFALPSTEVGPIAITTADFNGDGYPDLAILNQTSKNVSILEGNGDGTFTEFAKSPWIVGNLPVTIASGSLSGSSGPALAIANQADNSITVYLGNGDGTFAASSQSPLTTGTTPTGIAIADFAQQSNGGIAVANTGDGTVTVYLDLGSGLFTSAVEPAVGTNPTAIVPGDFTNSTFPDIAVTNNISGAIGQVTLIVSPASLISNAGISQQPYPGSEYTDIGIKFKTTSQLHDNNEVTLQMEFEIKSLSGNNVNGIPIISNRSVTQTVRLKENETSLVTGLLNKDETRTITGIPGLAPLPGIGYAFGSRNTTFDDDEFLILITPRRVRAPVHESKTIYAGVGDTSGRGSTGGNAPISAPREPGQERPPVPSEPAPAPPTTAPPEQPSGAPLVEPPAQTPEQPPAGQPPAGPPTAPPPGQEPPATPPEPPPQKPD
jgi:Flp pilus assembly secretin CpaC